MQASRRRRDDRWTLEAVNMQERQPTCPFVQVINGCARLKRGLTGRAALRALFSLPKNPWVFPSNPSHPRVLPTCTRGRVHLKLPDDAHGSLLVVLPQGIVLQNPGIEVLVQGLGRNAQNLTLQVVDVHDAGLKANASLDIPGHLVGVHRSQHHIVVVGRDGVVAGAVDGPGLVACHLVEPALFAGTPSCQ